MSLKLSESQSLAQIAELLYGFLPASGNNSTSFPIAAANAGVSEHWSLTGSKGPAIAALLRGVYEHDRHRFCPLILQVVQLAMVYRGRREPLTRGEIDNLNELLRDLEFKISDLNDPKFLGRLSGSAASPPLASAPATPTTRSTADRVVTARLQSELLAMSPLPPQERGYAFERFLNSMFAAYNLAPREPFRNRGEQIDGSFVHNNDVFLLEAKWQSREVAAQALWSFAARVETKSTWGRGLFISESGFTEDGLHAFRQGKPTPLVCMDGLDIYSMLERNLSFVEVLDRKKRRAAETGAAFVPVRDLF